ncbi:DUF5131 family protein [Dyadobacter sp. 50-39]|uniref:DUF5131 family protein n=1 Tax=Dyadobacter sp. 50-39 TaxID=1895756 RepID=UPI000AB45E04|nr:phage Gp37/Gp68 family protein [Dyadobacter sp. 50-39]
MTWNPTTGCTKVSSGCKFCYAEIMSRRLHAMGVEKYRDNFALRTHNDALEAPYSWKKSKIVFVNSMSDLFHPEVPLAFIKEVFRVMNDNPHHIFQVLTKRSERLLELSSEFRWTDNIWMGVSVENERVVNRISSLRKVEARIKFLSIEPLLGPLPHLNLEGIDWVIVGGESGPRCRPIKPIWVTDIQQQCMNQNVSFFFKQWGGRDKKKSGRILNGRTYDEMPRLKI